MKVKELIEILEKQDQNKDVVTYLGGNHHLSDIIEVVIVKNLDRNTKFNEVSQNDIVLKFEDEFSSYLE